VPAIALLVFKTSRRSSIPGPSVSVNEQRSVECVAILGTETNQRFREQPQFIGLWPSFELV